MKLIRRQLTLLRYLQKQPQWGQRELAAALHVAAATVKNDLLQLTPLLREHGVEISIRSGGGIRLIGRENLSYLRKTAQTMQEFSLESQVRLLLLMSDDFMVLQDMADALFISKSLLEKVMSILLQKYDDEIISMRRHGIRMTSTQFERRNLFAELLLPYFKGIDFKAETRLFHRDHFPLLDFVTEEEAARAAKAVGLLRAQRAFSFTDESQRLAYLQMVYITYVHRAFRMASPGPLAGELSTGMKGEALCQELAQDVVHALGLPVDERAYFRYLFLSLRKQKMEDSAFYREEMQGALNEILTRIEGRLVLDLSGDEALLSGLAVHLYTTVIRRDLLKTTFQEHEGQGIRIEYPIGFEMAVIAAQVLAEMYDYQVLEEELLYLTLHFQAALERLRSTGQHVRVLVVCHYGMAAANLIAERLTHLHAGIFIIGSTSMQSFLAHDAAEADLVVSTEAIANTEGLPPVLYVSPTLPAQELAAVRQFVETQGQRNVLLLYLMRAHVMDMERANNAEEALTLAARKLEEAGAVTGDYLGSLLEREYISSTDLGTIAVPHGNPDLVRETALLIIRLKQPLRWRVSDISYVFIFAVSRVDMGRRLPLISSFYKRLVSEELRHALPEMQALPVQEFRLELAHLIAG